MVILTDVRCPHCKADYLESTVERRTDLDVNVEQYYDQKGSLKPAVNNQGYECSRGHTFLVEVSPA